MERPVITLPREPRLGAGGRPQPLGPRALRVGLRTSLLVPLAAAAWVALLGDDGRGLGPWLGIFLGLVVAGAIVAFLPWDHVHATDIGRRILHAWAVLDVLLITLAGRSAGPGEAALPLAYAVAIVFFAILFSSRAQLAFLAFLLACYAAVMLPVGFQPLPFAMLAVFGVLASFLSAELRRRIAAHDRARVESERRWAVVGAVSSVARDMTASEPRRVLQGIVDAIVALGYETAAIHVPDAPAELRVVLPAGIGADPALGIHSMPDAIRTRVLEEGRDTILSLGDGDRRGVHRLRTAGATTLAATPILVGDRPAGALVVATTAPDGIAPREVEAFAMLAATASMALGNARRADERRQVEDHLADADRVRADVTATLAKEVRKPLVALTETSRALGETFGGEDRQRLIRRLIANATALDVTLGGTLDLALLDAEPAPVETEDVDLGDLVRAALDRSSASFDGREPETQIADGVVVQANRRLIGAAVEHLLVSAARSSPPGKPVRIEVAPAGEGAIVRFAGDSVIPADQVARIREPLADRDAAVGPWIRLALAANIVEVHGSQLQILSEPTRGTTVWFVLPGEGSAQPRVAGRAEAVAAPVQLSLDDALLPAAAAAAAATVPPEVEVPEDEPRSTPLAAAALAATAATSLVVTGVLPELLPERRPVATESRRDDDRDRNGDGRKRDRSQQDGGGGGGVADGGGTSGGTSNPSAAPSADTTDGAGSSTGGTGEGGGDGGGGDTGGGSGGGAGGGGGEPAPSPSDGPGKSEDAPGQIKKDSPTPTPSPTPAP